MKFLAGTLIVHRLDPVTGVQKPTHDRLREVASVLRREIPDPSFDWGPVFAEPESEPVPADH